MLIVALGPIEYVIFGFPGNKFTGKVAPELKKLLDSGTIRVLDLVFVSKDENGDTATFEYEDHGAAPEEVRQAGLHAAESLEPNSSAALLIWEDTWAAPLVEALRDANGVVLEGAQIPHDLIEAAMADLEPAS